MRNVRLTLYILVQCTWGCLQTIAGGVIFLWYIRCRHFNYHGAVVTEWPSDAGLSLGMFTFVPIKQGIVDTYYDKTIVHEYGHTVQSLILGPMYLLVIGIPSVVWCSLPQLENMRHKKGRSYYQFYTESWANGLGRRVTKEETF